MSTHALPGRDTRGDSTVFLKGVCVYVVDLFILPCPDAARSWRQLLRQHSLTCGGRPFVPRTNEMRQNHGGRSIEPNSIPRARPSGFLN